MAKKQKSVKELLSYVVNLLETNGYGSAICLVKTTK